MKNKSKTTENYLIVKIIRGNRQCREINIKASKRFQVGHETYIIKSKCIKTEITGNKIESVIYYTEGNPNPHSFEKKNIGIEYKEFNELYGEDLYDMLVKIQSDKKAFYLIIMYLMVLSFSIVTMITGFFNI